MFHLCSRSSNDMNTNCSEDEGKDELMDEKVKEREREIGGRSEVGERREVGKGGKSGNVMWSWNAGRSGEVER